MQLQREVVRIEALVHGEHDELVARRQARRAVNSKGPKGRNSSAQPNGLGVRWAKRCGLKGRDPTRPTEIICPSPNPSTVWAKKSRTRSQIRRTTQRAVANEVEEINSVPVAWEQGTGSRPFRAHPPGRYRPSPLGWAKEFWPVGPRGRRGQPDASGTSAARAQRRPTLRLPRK